MEPLQFPTKFRSPSIAAVFKNTPLLIAESPGGLRDGDYYPCEITNAERWRDTKRTQRVSDLDYLLRAVGETQLPIFGDNLAYIAALTKHGGETFEADVEIVWPCSDRHAIFVRDQCGHAIKVPTVYGNGKWYTVRDASKDEQGQYPETIEVRIMATDPAAGHPTEYAAVVRGRNNLSRFRA